MKKYIVLILIFCFTQFLKAQERFQLKKNEISIKLGHSYLKLIQKAINENKETNPFFIKTQFPLLALTYKRSLSKKFDIEAFLAYERYGSQIKIPNELGRKKTLDFINFSTTIMGISMNFNYINKKKFQLYSGLGIGLIKPRIEKIEIVNKETLDLFEKEILNLFPKKIIPQLKEIKDEIENLINQGKDKFKKNIKIPSLLIPHFALLGFRYGQKFGISSEIGFGYKGLINIGFFYRF